MAQCGARGREQPLELQGGDHVGEPSIAKLCRLLGLVNLVARGEDHCANLNALFLLDHIVVDRIYAAGEDARHAL